MKVLGKLIALLGSILLRDLRGQTELLAAEVNGKYSQRVQQCLPKTLVELLVTGEDHRFYRHAGVDPIAIGGSFWRMLKGKGQRLSGASTIEQQFVRVLTGHRQRTIGRKLRELTLACCLNLRYSKLDIAGMYLTVAYFGWGMNGVEQACQRLSLRLCELTEGEAASLIARLKYPEPQYPTAVRTALIGRRARHILELTCSQVRDVGEVTADATVLHPGKL